MTIQVDGISGFAYLVAIGEHELVVDQPVEDGGEDLGPTPTDLFVAGLASCAAYYAGRFLARRGYGTDTVSARCRYNLAKERPARVESIEISLDLPDGLSEELRAATLRSAEHCTVHNSLVRPPTVHISMDVKKVAA